VLIVAALGLPLIDRTSRLYRRALAHWDADDYGATLPPASRNSVSICA